MCGVMVSMLVSNVVDCGFEPCWGQFKDLNLVFAIYLLCMQHGRVRAENLLGIGTTCRLLF
jgi:hypothetical protein